MLKNLNTKALRVAHADDMVFITYTEVNQIMTSSDDIVRQILNNQEIFKDFQEVTFKVEDFQEETQPFINGWHSVIDKDYHSYIIRHNGHVISEGLL